MSYSPTDKALLIGVARSMITPSIHAATFTSYMALITMQLRPSAMGFEFHVSFLPKDHAGEHSLFIIYLKVIFTIAKAFIGYEILLSLFYDI